MSRLTRTLAALMLVLYGLASMHCTLEAVAQNDHIERVLLQEFPDEIEHIWTRLGTAEVATDPMGVELADFFLALKPREQWKRARTQSELTDQMRAVLSQVPGLRPAFSQPIEMRLNEMIAGARGDLAVKVYGDDLEELRRLGSEVQAVLAGLRGASEVTVEQLTGQSFLEVRVDAQAAARYGVPTRHVLNVVEAVGSRRVGEVREGLRRFPLVVRLSDRQRTDPEALAATLIPTAGGGGTVFEPSGPNCRARGAVHHQPGMGTAAHHRAGQCPGTRREKLCGGSA